jgi:hypothetical protein
MKSASVEKRYRSLSTEEHLSYSDQYSTSDPCLFIGGLSEVFGLHVEVVMADGAGIIEDFALRV